MIKTQAGRHQLWREIPGAINATMVAVGKRPGAVILPASSSFPVPCAAAFSVIGNGALPKFLLYHNEIRSYERGVL